MTALLEFQFSYYNPRRESHRKRLARIITVGGLLISFCVIIRMQWRLI